MGFIIGAVFIGLILAGLLAPIVMLSNRKKLKEMDKLIEGFEQQTFSTPELREKAKMALKKQLVKVKAGIVADKKSEANAADKISIL